MPRARQGICVLLIVVPEVIAARRMTAVPAWIGAGDRGVVGRITDARPKKGT
jgi:hypothetical protein